MHGKACVLPDAAHQPDPNMRQRAVFSLTVAPASAAATDPGLERVARAVNLLTASGVPKKQLDFVVLLSEGATDSALADPARSEEHTSELKSLMRISYAVFCLKKKKKQKTV